MPFHWLLRMARWVRHPPSPRRVTLVLAVVAACLALWAVERWVTGPWSFDPVRVPTRLP